MYLGAHIGIAKGWPEAVTQARSIGCDALQVFAKSPRSWTGPAISPASADAFRSAVATSGIRRVLVHHGYLANLAHPRPDQLRRSQQALKDELSRAELLGADGLVLHPGAHLGSGVEAGIASIVASLNHAFEESPGSIRVLLENSAGQGSTLGRSFEELRQMLAGVHEHRRVGICIDTCHLFAAGMEFRTPTAYGERIDEIEATIGVSSVRAFHLNDARAPLGSHLDRHANIGTGEIGVAGFAGWVRDPRWSETPGVLETPLDDRGYALYAEDLVRLRSLLGSGTSRIPAPRTGSSTSNKRPRSARN
jgi:deoxyribonuclease-4